MAGIAYTEEQIRWLKEQSAVYTVAKDLTAAFNRHFGCQRTTSAIQQTLLRNCGIKREAHNAFTPDEDAWLLENYSRFNSQELSRRFSEAFCHPSSPQEPHFSL